jgi:hypothetical protein
MLDAHPDLAIPPETYFLYKSVREWGEGMGSRDVFYETLVSHHRWPAFHVDQRELAARLDAIEPFDPREALRAFYHLYAQRFQKPRWGDKTPLNINRLTAIHRLLPEARFVHLIRDGRDVFLSVRDLPFGPNSVDEAAEWWVQIIGRARLHARSLPHYLEVRYEDLVLDTEPALKGVCKFTELPWSSDMLQFHTRASERLGETRLRATAEDGEETLGRGGMFNLTKRPPEPGRIGRWRTELSQAELRRFEEIGGDLLQELGYPLSKSRDG